MMYYFTCCIFVPVYYIYRVRQKYMLTMQLQINYYFTTEISVIFYNSYTFLLSFNIYMLVL